MGKTPAGGNHDAFHGPSLPCSPEKPGVVLETGRNWDVRGQLLTARKLLGVPPQQDGAGRGMKPLQGGPSVVLYEGGVEQLKEGWGEPEP